MNLDLQLFINGERIDIDQNLIAPLTYSVADVKSPEKRSRNRSKNIKINGTASNMSVMYPTYNLSLQDDGAGFNFNPNAELPARITRNGYIIFQGVANYIESSLKKGAWTFTYKIFGNSIGLFEELGDRTLSSLGWSEYNHDLTIANLQLSTDTSVDVNGVPTSNFTGGQPDGFGYIYPLINFGYAASQTNVKTNELIPYFYMVEAFIKCFAVGGYTLLGNWKDTEYIKRIIFGQGGGELINLPSAEVAAREATYSISGSDTQVTTSINSSFSDPNKYPIGFQKIYFMADIAPMSIAITTDPRLQMDETTGLITVGAAGDYNINLALNFDYTNNFSGGSPTATANHSSLSVSALVNGVGAASGGIGNVLEGVGIQSEINFQTRLNAGDTIRFIILFNLNSNLNYAYAASPADVPQHNWGFTFNASSLSVTSLNTGLLEGDLVEAGRWLPDMKCRDFVNSIITMFNLYMSEPTADNEIRIEPFEDYYLGSDVAEPYTKKLDYDKEIKIQSNAGIEGKVYNFKFKEDMDGYKEYYFQRWGSHYGDLEYQIPSTFKKGEKEYKVSFAQTIPIDVGGLVIPQIVKKDSTTGLESPHKGKPRIFVYNGNQNGDWNLLNSTTGAATAIAKYPQAHHLDDIAAPTKDLNFGVPIEIYYTTTQYTTNTLFAIGYETQIRELTSNDSKFLTAYFKIDETDLQGEFMRNLVNVNGVVYRKNLISDFNAAGYDTTKHELIKLLAPETSKTSLVPYQPPVDVPAEQQLRLINMPSNDTRTIAITDQKIIRYSPNLSVMDTSLGALNVILGNDNPTGSEKTISRKGSFNVTVAAETGTISGESVITLNNDFDSYTFVKDLISGWIIKDAFSLSFAGLAITIVTGNVTLLDGSEWVEITPVATFSIKLPAAPTKGVIKSLVDVTGITSVHAITVAGNGKNIDGVASYVINSNYETVQVRYNGTQWNKV